MLRPIWIAELRWRPGLVGKLGSARGWTRQDVDDALLCRRHQRVREDRDPDRGLRLLVECAVAGRPATAVLRPTPDVDVFVLVTAHPAVGHPAVMTRVETGKGVQEYDPAWDDDLHGDEMPERFRDLLEEPATIETVEPLSVLDVASAILKFKGPLDTYQLQKLCYYAQAQHVAFYNTRLFREPIEAWPNGPVIRELYRRHAGKRRIEALPEGNPVKVEEQPAAADTVNAVLKEYGGFTGQQLVEMTHREQPWRDARRSLRPKQASRVEIPVEALRDYYQGFDDIEPLDEDNVKFP